MRIVLVAILLAVIAWLVLRPHRAKVASPTTTHETIELEMRAPTIVRDVVPDGTLRFEGQVVDEREQPVAHAEIAIDTAPPTIVRSGEDGSFAVTGLVARGYLIEARTDEAHAGPIEVLLGPSTEPVILRMKKAGVVEVEVRASTGEAIEGADLELRSTLVWHAKTDREGHARVTGVGRGWPTLHVVAAGYASSARMLRVAGAVTKEIVTLERGARVSGRVVDEDGHGLASARVVAIAASEPFPVVDAQRDAVVTSSDGSWSMSAVAAGSWRFSAQHPDRAPGSTPPVVLDGTHAYDGVRIALVAGAKLEGIVVDERGTPVPSAKVRVTARGAITLGVERETYTRGDGTFTVSSLPSRAVDVIASTEDASSTLAHVAPPGTVKLTIALRGEVSGLVVTPAGEPVPEAPVEIEPSWTGAIDERDAWYARGVPGVIADGGGRFSVRGLPTGWYQLRAARPGAELATDATAASTGDREARVIVRGDGRVTGRVAYSDGTSPPLFTIAIGAHEQLFDEPRFACEAPAGHREVVVTGPSFERTTVPAIELVEGKTVDLGTIVVQRGRSVSGRVLDRNGTPIANASVAGGLLLTGDGQKLNVVSEGFRVRETTSDAQGRYVLRGFGEHPIVVVAEGSAGRSLPVRLPRGPSSIELDLVLQPTSALSGTITKNGVPVANTVVIANPRGAISSNFFVLTGADGTYAFDTLSSGEWVVAPMIGGGGLRPKDMFYTSVTITSATPATRDIAITDGALTLTVAVEDERGDPVRVAQVLVVGREVTAPTVEALLEASWLPETTEIVPLSFRMTMGGPVKIGSLPPGAYSVCVAPIAVDPNDAAAMQAFREAASPLALTCRSVTLTSDQSISVKTASAAAPSAPRR